MPRVSDRGRVVAGVSTLALVLTILLVQVTAAVPASAADLVVVPNVGSGGLPVTVTGSGFDDEPVTLCWDNAGCSDLGEDTPVLGFFTTTITIPEDAVPGQHLIYACQSGGCSSAAIEVVGAETTMPPETTVPPETTTTTLEPTTSDPTTTPTTIQTTTTTTSSSTTTLLGSTTTRPSSFPSSTEGPTDGPTDGPGTTLVGTTPPPIFGPSPPPIFGPSPPPIFGPSPPPIFGPSPPPVFGTPTTSLPGITDTTDPLAEDRDQNEDQDQEGQFGRSDADPPASILDSVMSGVFIPAPEASPDSELGIGAPDGGTPIPEASIGPDPQAQQTSGNRSPADFPMPDLGVWGLWLMVTIGLTAAALAFDALRHRRNG